MSGQPSGNTISDVRVPSTFMIQRTRSTPASPAQLTTRAAAPLGGRLVRVAQGLVGEGRQGVRAAEPARNVGADVVRDVRCLVEWDLTGDEGTDGGHLCVRVAVPGAPIDP